MRGGRGRSNEETGEKNGKYTGRKAANRENGAREKPPAGQRRNGKAVTGQPKVKQRK